MVGPDLVLSPGVKITLKRKTEDETEFGMDDLSLDEKPVAEQNDGLLVCYFCNCVLTCVLV